MTLEIHRQAAYDELGMKSWANVSTSEILQTLAIRLSEGKNAFGEGVRSLKSLPPRRRGVPKEAWPGGQEATHERGMALLT